MSNVWSMKEGKSKTIIIFKTDHSRPYLPVIRTKMMKSHGNRNKIYPFGKFFNKTNFITPLEKYE